MSEVTSKELIIIGGGPAGLKAAEEAQKAGIDYVVLEKGAVGQAWREVRPHMQLLSPCHPQRDWTSISNSFPIWKMPVERPYCSAREFVMYLEAFAGQLKLNVKTQTAVEKIERKDGNYSVLCSGGERFTAPFVIVATGIFGSPYIPPIPGAAGNPLVTHSHRYQSAADFKGRRVLVVGAGNSAAEIAIDLAGKALVYLSSRRELRFFSQTKKLYHIRGISESYLKELIAMEFIRHFPFQEIQRIEGKKVFFKEWSLEVDHVIFATGYRPNLNSLQGLKLSIDKYHCPAVTQNGESQEYPDLFFAGPLSYHSQSSIVIHGFVKFLPRTIAEIKSRLGKGTPQ